MTFKEMATDGTCACCNKKTKIVVLASQLGPFSNAYCEDCWNNGYEPYSDCISFMDGLQTFEYFKPKYVAYIRKQLAFHHKTEEEFFADVQKSEEEFEAWCLANSMPEASA